MYSIYNQKFDVEYTVTMVNYVNDTSNLVFLVSNKYYPFRLISHLHEQSNLILNLPGLTPKKFPP